MSLIGQEYKQPRVFAHDAWPVVIGAINYTWDINTKQKPLNWAGIRVTDAGAGYVAGNTIVLTITGTATAAATLTIDSVDGAGAVTGFSFDPSTSSNLGIGYSVGDTETDVAAPASPFACTIVNIDIPNTQNAGCCLYFSPAAAGAANITVIMEGAAWTGSAVAANFGYAASDVRTFTLMPVGIFMPILVKQITSPTVTNDILALY
jgi:hypothetical protein